MSLQVPRVLLPDGPGVQLRVTAASQAGAVRDEGSHPHVEGAGRGQPGAQEIQGRAAGYGRRRLGQRSVTGDACWGRHK